MKTAFTTGDVARICQVVPATVVKWIDNGLLKGRRLPTRGQPRRVNRADLMLFLEKHGVPIDTFLYREKLEELIEKEAAA